MIELLKIKVWNGKIRLQFYITLLEMRKHKGNYFCAYVYLDKLPNRELSFETYRRNNTVGIDTAHLWNEFQTLEEKRNDALRQIRELIEDWLGVNTDYRNIEKILKSD